MISIPPFIKLINYFIDFYFFNKLQKCLLFLQPFVLFHFASITFLSILLYFLVCLHNLNFDSLAFISARSWFT